MNKQSFFISAAAVGLAIISTGCNKSSDSNNVAVVDGTPITLDQYHRFIERMPTVKVSANGAPQEARVYQTLGFQAIQTLIGQDLMLELAKDEGVLPDSKAIEAELKFQQAIHPDFVQQLQSSQGMTLQEIRDSLQLDLAKEKLITKGIVVTTQDAKQYVKDHPKAFSSPAEASLLWIIVNSTKSKTKVDQELASGQPFGSVAAEYSVANDARKNGGKYPYTVIAQFPPTLQDLVGATPETKATNWIQDHDNWVKFYVQSKTPAKVKTIDDNQYEFVRRGLAMQKGSQASDLQKKLIDKLKVAKIQVNRAPLTDLWKLETQKLAEATQTPTSAAAGTPPTAGTAGTAPAPAPAKK